ncbi:MAG: DUF1800 family protein [Pseudolabrys sp.]|nr:DUF1800 family protein [Pseudolabrys sp.]
MAPDPKTTRLDSKSLAALALHRFGFGPRAGSLAAVAADPRGAVLAELDRPGAGRIADDDLLSGGEAARAAFDFRQERKAQRLAQREERNQERAAQAKAKADGTAMADGKGIEAQADQTMQADDEQRKRKLGPGIPQQIFLEEAKTRFDSALSAEIGLIDRLTWFWSNHFCVSVDKGQVRPLAGAFEREAIRAHVLGKFSDMLLAVETHPAMLLYLDNARSIGPNSIAGRRQNKGLNENLAREIMELHTLGVNGGYTQDDVTRFANVITGWTVVPFKRDPEHGGEFDFNPRTHEPGSQTVLGKVYEDRGVEQGRAVLLALARHPATARHIAVKLVRHFVADDPPNDLVELLAKRFRDTDGNLKEVTRALVGADAAWSAPRGKLKRPGEWMVSALRASGVTPPDIRPIVQAQNLLGEPLWKPPAPKGFPDDSASWIDGVTQRLDIANQLSRRVGGLVDPDDVAEAALGPLLSAETRQALKRAESRPQALALLFMSPEFLRR